MNAWISIINLHIGVGFDKLKISSISVLLGYAMGSPSLSSDGSTVLLLIQRLQVRLERLDLSVLGLKILVQAISFSDQLLFPLTETVFLRLDLIGESLAKHIFLFTELGVIVVLDPIVIKKESNGEIFVAKRKDRFNRWIMTYLGSPNFLVSIWPCL
jgi:hypothetical protein